MADEMWQGWMRRGKSGLRQVGPLRERRDRLHEPGEREEEQCSDDRVRSEEVAASHCRGACRGLSFELLFKYKKFKKSILSNLTFLSNLIEQLKKMNSLEFIFRLKQIR